MNIMKKLLSVFVVLAMLLTFVACDSSSKKNDDDDEDEDEEETVKLNNDFEGTYEGEIDFVEFYCFTLNYPIDNVEEYAKEIDDYYVTAILDIKDDTIDFSFECKDKDIKSFVNDFYTAAAESQFDEDEIDEKLEEVEERIENEITSLEEMIDETEENIAYEFDGESVLNLDFDGDTVEFEIEWGKKKITITDSETESYSLEQFAEMFEDVTFKKVANYEDGKKDDESNDSSKDESNDEGGTAIPVPLPDTDTPVSEVPDFSFEPDVSDIESSEPDVDVPVESNGITGTYTGEIDLLDLFYIMFEYNDEAYEINEYMEYTYIMDATLTITDSTVSLTIAPDDVTVDAFVEAFYAAAIQYYNDNNVEVPSDSEVQSAIAAKKALFKSFINEFWLSNCSYTYDSYWEEMSVSVQNETVIFSLFVYTDRIEIYSIYDNEGGASAANLSTVYKGVEFIKN